MANAVKTLSDVIRKGVAKKAPESTQNTGMTVMPNYIKLIEREDVSEETLRKQANEYADDLYADSINKIKIDAEKKLNDLNVRLNKTESGAIDKKNKAIAEYKDTVEKNTDDAVKQGLVNSSVYTGMQQKAESDYNAVIKELNDALYSATDGIKREADVIIKARDIALSNYEIKKAAEYEKKLSELREAEYRAREEVRKKNEILSYYQSTYEEDAKRAQEAWEKAKKNGQV